MKLKSKSALLMALVVLVGTTSAYVSHTYAKYTAAVSATGSATVARWNFDVDNTSTDIVVNIDDTNIQSGTLVSGMLAPGTEGTFNIALSNEHSDVGVYVTMAITDFHNIPLNMHFKQGSTFNSGTAFNPRNQMVTCYIAAGQTLTVPFAWQWPYETGDTSSKILGGDSRDITDGQAVPSETESSEIVYTNKALDFTFTISGTQVNPTDSSTVSTAGGFGANSIAVVAQTV